MSKKGLRCESNEDGTLSCKPYINKKGEKFSTGSDFKVVIDPQTCKGRIIGDVNKDDSEIAEIKLKEEENLCRRGF